MAFLALFRFATPRSIGEFKRQAKRAEKGWFPKNPLRAQPVKNDEEGLR
ncbi:MAG: DUF4491 family protein [Clostridiales bacterium]|nr:DUF4491 family protein [Clostridiales bacterium]